MPSEKCNLIMAKATGLTFSLFDVTSHAFWHTVVYVNASSKFQE